MDTEPENPTALTHVRGTTSHLMATLDAHSQQLQTLFQTTQIGEAQNDSIILGLVLELQKGQHLLSRSILDLSERLERLETAWAAQEQSSH